jgi:hypothetical protein
MKTYFLSNETTRINRRTVGKGVFYASSRPTMELEDRPFPAIQDASSIYSQLRSNQKVASSIRNLKTCHECDKCTCPTHIQINFIGLILLRWSELGLVCLVIFSIRVCQLMRHMDSSRIPNNLLNYRPHGKRSLVRPLKRWSETVTGHLA